MREILFRGKKSDGKWVEGGFCYGGNRQEPIICPKYDFSKEVIPETVGQYTGLRDCKRTEEYPEGQMIFEGDIVKCSDETYDYSFIAVVMFGNPNGEYNWGFQLKRIRGAGANTDILLWVDMQESGAYIEVIGNIHDNPELLKGGVQE